MESCNKKQKISSPEIYKLQIIKEIVIPYQLWKVFINWECAGNEDLQRMTMKTFSEYHMSIYLVRHDDLTTFSECHISIYLFHHDDHWWCTNNFDCFIFLLSLLNFHLRAFWSKYSCCWLASSLIGFLHGILPQLDDWNYLDSVQSTIWLSEDLRWG